MNKTVEPLTLAYGPLVSDQEILSVGIALRVGAIIGSRDAFSTVLVGTDTVSASAVGYWRFLESIK